MIQIQKMALKSEITNARMSIGVLPNLFCICILNFTTSMKIYPLL